jgi:hypothetical protein
MELHLRFDPRTPGWLRRALLLGVPLAAMALTSVAVGAPPFAPGQVLKASDLNASFDELTAGLEKRPEFTEWAKFTPVLTAGGANVAISAADGNSSPGYWRRTGDSIEVVVTAVVPTCPMPNATLEWGLPNQLTMDFEKAPFYAAIGNGFVIHVANVTITEHSVMALTNKKAVAMPASTNGVNVQCSALGPNGSVRFRFTAPIEGWGIAD